MPYVLLTIVLHVIRLQISTVGQLKHSVLFWSTNHMSSSIPLSLCGKDIKGQMQCLQFSAVETEADLILVVSSAVFSREPKIFRTICPTHRSSLGIRRGRIKLCATCISRSQEGNEASITSGKGNYFAKLDEATFTDKRVYPRGFK